jgi:hypothetical protein
VENVTIQAKAQAKAKKKNVGLFERILWKRLYRNANITTILRTIRKDLSTGSIGNALIDSLEY